MTVDGHLEIPKVSNCAKFKCIDAPESTTNSLSTGLNLEGEGRHHFYVGEKNVVFCSSSNYRIFFASFNAASRAQCSCHPVSSWVRPSNFGALGLHWWGSLGQIALSDWFWSWSLALRNTALVNRTHRIVSSMVELFRELDLGGSTSWDTQPKFFVSFNIATALLSPFFLDLFGGLFFNPEVCKDALTPECKFSQDGFAHVPFKDVPCTADETFSQTDFGLKDCSLSQNFAHLAASKASEKELAVS